MVYPTQGPEAFVARRRSEERKRGATTLQSAGNDNRAVARYNKIPGGRDQQTNLLDQKASKEQPRGRAEERGREGRRRQQESNTTPTKDSTKPTHKTNNHRQTQSATRQARDTIKTKPHEPKTPRQNLSRT